MTLHPFPQFPIQACLWIGFALVCMACSRSSGPEPGAAAGDPAASGMQTPTGAAGQTVAGGPVDPSTAAGPAPAATPGEAAPRTSGTGVMVCDKYIRMVCGCAQKRQNADLQKACELARQSLPEWQKSHKEEGEELAVVKACQRAFLHIQSTGQCDDISY